METSKRARRRKLDTPKTDLEPPLVVRRRAGCPSSDHHKMESEGPAEKYRAVIDGVIPKMNRSAQGGARSSLHFLDEGVLIHPPHQGVCGRHGTEEQHVTSGGAGRVSGWHRSKQTYKRKRSGERSSISIRTAE